MSRNEEASLEMKDGSFDPPRKFIRTTFWVPVPLKIGVTVQPDSTNEGIKEEQSVFVLLLRKMDGTLERYCYSQLTVSGTSTHIVFRQHSLERNADGKWSATPVASENLVERYKLNPRIIWLAKPKTLIRRKVLLRRIDEEGVLAFNPNVAAKLNAKQKIRVRRAYNVALEKFLEDGDVGLSRIFNTTDNYSQEWYGDNEDGQFMTIINADSYATDDVEPGDDDIEDLMGGSSIVSERSKEPGAEAEAEADADTPDPEPEPEAKPKPAPKAKAKQAEKESAEIEQL